MIQLTKKNKWLLNSYPKESLLEFRDRKKPRKEKKELRYWMIQLTKKKKSMSKSLYERRLKHIKKNRYIVDSGLKLMIGNQVGVDSNNGFENMCIQNLNKDIYCMHHLWYQN